MDCRNEFATATFNFVPNGSPVTHVRDIVETATCDGCHDELSHHGGQRRQVALCILCHQPQSHEESVGNTVDFKVMIHKLHFGLAVAQRACRRYLFAFRHELFHHRVSRLGSGFR